MEVAGQIVNNRQKVLLEIYKAVRLGKWLYVSYKNLKGDVTDFWIAIKNICPKTKKLTVDGLSLKDNAVTELTLSLDGILSASVIEGTFVDTEKTSDLINKIETCPSLYFSNIGDVPVNNILEYYKECYKLDSVPYITDFTLVEGINEELLKLHRQISLSNAQYKAFVEEFSENARKKARYSSQETTFKTIALNALSVKEIKGLYVLAYYKLYLCPKEKALKIDKEVTINKEFNIGNGKLEHKLLASRYLSHSYMQLFDEFEKNRVELTKQIAKNKFVVDDAPHIIALQVKVNIDFNLEFAPITQLLDKDLLPQPLKAFFGKLKEIKRSRKNYPLIIADKNKINLDQLLAVHKALKSSTSYIEGPPGTGKTNTILNIILTAYFSNKRVLVTSNNNKPIDGIVEKIAKLKYRSRQLYFPIIRLGNNAAVKAALIEIRELYFKAQQENIYEKTLEKSKLHREEVTKALSKLLEKHEKLIELNETLVEARKIAEANRAQMAVISKIQYEQIPKIEQQIKELGAISEKEALSLICSDVDELFKYIHYSSAAKIKLLEKPAYKELLEIILREPPKTSDEILLEIFFDKQLQDFNLYIKNDENLAKFLDVFPIVATTNISAHRLGSPKQHFDITIMDEASQCNTAVSLVPILRGKNLVLVGDPQQLNPVIMLNPSANLLLLQKFKVPPSYDYIKNSIYKVYINNDPISDATLLKTHYRCDENIINFSNKKYYNNKLIVKSGRKLEQALQFIDIVSNESGGRNTSFTEAQAVVKFVKDNPLLDVGIVTPFTNQSELINKELKRHDLTSTALCGTVHSFQGDEKDVILFSLALTKDTSVKTYDWLKNNKELLNVATSRAKEKLVMLASSLELQRLHSSSQTTEDDLHELYRYILSNGVCEISCRSEKTRALGFKPYNTQIEEAFAENLKHILSIYDDRTMSILQEQTPASIFKNEGNESLAFFTNRFDFVIFQKQGLITRPILAIELDGPEHELEHIKARDKIKEDIASKYGLALIRVENLYARQYIKIKNEILLPFLKKN